MAPQHNHNSRGQGRTLHHELHCYHHPSGELDCQSWLAGIRYWEFDERFHADIPSSATPEAA
jgi:hypothetical protein